ncbi:MAG: hypothetical protein R3195_16535 [Gemmatimonadota bacterium]|nr:hypothetical protein [Gemmatimonadota bacterium]
MNTVIRLALLVIALNVVRYLVGGIIEGVTIMGPMHAPMAAYPDVFDLDFTTTDFAISLVYNYLMWFVAAVVFHLLNPTLSGSIWVRSLKSYLLMAAFFCSLAAVYMNHYTAAVKPFYLWSMVDALIVFPLVGLANAVLYPLFFRGTAHAPGPGTGDATDAA